MVAQNSKKCEIMPDPWDRIDTKWILEQTKKPLPVDLEKIIQDTLRLRKENRELKNKLNNKQ